MSHFLMVISLLSIKSNITNDKLEVKTRNSYVSNTGV